MENATPSTPSVKIFHGNDIYRVSAQHMGKQWGPFCDRLRELTRKPLEGVELGNNVKITYTDDEGDVIAIRSQPELEEAMDCQGPIKKFRVEAADEAEVISIPSTPVHVRPAQVIECSPDDIVVTVDLVPMQRKNNPNAEVLRLLQQNKLREAEQVFQQHEDTEDKILLYNGACIHALLGNGVKSCVLLDKAVAAGYRNLQHLVSDSDLDSIRHLPEYINLVQLLTALLETNEEVPATSVHTPAVQEEQKPAPVAEPVPYPFQSVINILTDMGLADTEQLRELIQKLNGDIANIVEHLLSTTR